MPKEETLQTYSSKLELNFFQIEKVTITDHCQKKHSKVINDQLILELLKELDGKKLEPTNYPHEKIFCTIINYQDKNYRLIFHFKRGQTNHLWIINCYRKN